MAIKTQMIDLYVLGLRGRMKYELVTSFGFFALCSILVILVVGYVFKTQYFSKLLL